MALHKANFMRRFHMARMAAHVLTYNTLRYLNLRRVLAISMRTRYRHVHRNFIMYVEQGTLYNLDTFSCYIAINIWTERVCIQVRKEIRRVWFHILFFYDRRRRGFLARCKSGRGQGHKAEFVSKIIRESSVSFYRRNAFSEKCASRQRAVGWSAKNIKENFDIHTTRVG